MNHPLWFILTYLYDSVGFYRNVRDFEDKLMKTHAGWEDSMVLFIVCLRTPVFEFLSILFDFIS